MIEKALNLRSDLVWLRDLERGMVWLRDLESDLRREDIDEKERERERGEKAV